MAEKRIEISEKTIEQLAALYPPLADHPRSKLYLSEALEFAAEKLTEMKNEAVELDRKTAAFCDDMIHFGLAENRNKVVSEALELFKREKKEALEAKMSERLSSY